MKVKTKLQVIFDYSTKIIINSLSDWFSYLESGATGGVQLLRNPREFGTGQKFLQTTNPIKGKGEKLASSLVNPRRC